MPVVVITGYDTDESRTRVLEAGAAGYVRKPVDDQMLLDSVAAALAQTSQAPAGARAMSAGDCNCAAVEVAMSDVLRGADYGPVRGYATAYDAETGKQVWRFFAVPGDPALGFGPTYSPIIPRFRSAIARV